MRIYLAARYSRREELCGYREELRWLGHDVQARWLDGKDEITNAHAGHERTRLWAGFARKEIQDVLWADLVVFFTEVLSTDDTSGCRHIEFGLALGAQTDIIIVGRRENLFHWLPEVCFCESWEEAKAAIEKRGKRFTGGAE